MEWIVVKIGAEMFDALHAYGLAIVLAYATESSIDLRDEGFVYKLKCSVTAPPQINEIPLVDILSLPTPDQLQVIEKNLPEVNVPLANLDGLLAALFTTRGPRLTSVFDLTKRQILDPSLIDQGLTKVSRAISRWQKYIAKKSRHSSGWLSDALKDYDISSPKIPFTDRNRGSDISVLMTLDPSFSLSTRRPLSDGRITDKTNIAIREPQYATLFAFVGAARFLRAQRLAGKLVNFYVPIPSSVILHVESGLPFLRSRSWQPANQAALYQWLSHIELAKSLDAHWSGLAYQTLQTQGASQSISVGRGYLDNLWLENIYDHVGEETIAYWKLLLASQPSEIPFEIDDLVDALKSRCPVAWTNHLKEISIYKYGSGDKKIRTYKLSEVKEIMNSMTNSKRTPLSAVLDHKEGTLRFGHALRQLGRVNNGELRDIIDDLDCVQSTDQLIRILAQAVQQCTVARAKSEFMIIPNDEDLRCLLDDIERYTAKTVVSILIMLAALRYPHVNEVPDNPESIPSQPNSELKEEKIQ